MATVLHIESQASEAQLITEALQELPDSLDVVTASSVHAGLRYLAGAAVDCVLLAYRLPDGDGLDCLRRIRTHYPDVPVIMVTGAGSEEVAVEAMRLGASDYIVKHGRYLPAVSAAVRKAIGRRELQRVNARIEGGIFVGRERELGRLRAAVDDALAGRGRLCLVAGEAGIGKTSLARVTAAHAAQRGLRVVWGRCEDTEGVPPYWPWMQIIRACLREWTSSDLRVDMGAGAANIAQIVSEVRERLPGLSDPPPLEAEEMRFRFFDSITTFLKNAARRRPLMLILDDLHWADKPSLLLLRFLAREIGEARLLVVGNCRDVEIDRNHPLAEVMSQLRHESVYEHVHGLSEEEVRAQLTALAGRNVPSTFARAIFRRSEGNPFFVQEIVRCLVDEGTIYFDGRRWTSRISPDEMRMPDSVRDVISRRLAHVSKDCRQVLAIASVFGREFDLDAVQRLVDLPGDRLFGTLREAVEARVITEAGRGGRTYRFGHALIQETLYEALPAARRVELHRQVGEALETLYAADTDAHNVELAYHFFEAASAGEAPRALRYAIRAAERAGAQMAHEQAARHYEMALHAQTLVDPANEEGRYELLLAMSHALWRAGEFDRAREASQQAADIARRLGSATRLARAALGFAGRLTGFGAAVCNERVVRLLEEALEGLGKEDCSLCAKVMGRLAEEIAFADELARRRLLAHQALEMARRIGDQRVLAAVLQSMHWALWSPEKVDQRLDLAREIVQLAEATGDRGMALEGHLFRCFALLELGEMPAVQREFAVCERLAAELRQPYSLWIVESTRACLAFVEARLDDVEALAQRALRLGEQAENPNAILFFGVQHAHLLWLRGRLADTEPMLLGFAEAFPLLLPTVRCSLALIYSEQGRAEDARREFEHFAADGFASLLPNVTWAMNVTFLAQVCAFLGDAERARRLYDLLRPFAGRNIMLPPVLPWGSASYYLGLLATTMCQWQAAVSHFDDALQMNEGMRMRHWLARTELAYGQMLVARGARDDREKAHGLLDRALEVAQDLSMPVVAERARSLLRRLAPVPVETSAGDLQHHVGGGPLQDTGSAAESQSGMSSAENIFHREGEYWTVAYAGKVCRLKDTKGMWYIWYLLCHPNEEIPAAFLWGHAPDRHGSNSWPRPARLLVEDDQPDRREGDLPKGYQPAGSSLDPMLDDRAKAELWKRRRELEEELAEADRLNDLGRAARLREEIEQIDEYLAAAVGLGGRDRPNDSVHDRIRQNVRKAIKSALDRIGAELPSLGRYLEDHIKTGAFCMYRPDPDHPVAWMV